MKTSTIEKIKTIIIATLYVGGLIAAYMWQLKTGNL